MKFAAITIVTATILTLAVTAFFYVVTPEAPLGAGAEENTAMQCVVEAHKAIEIAGDNLPNVKKGISDWVNWTK